MINTASITVAINKYLSEIPRLASSSCARAQRHVSVAIRTGLDSPAWSIRTTIAIQRDGIGRVTPKTESHHLAPMSSCLGFVVKDCNLSLPVDEVHHLACRGKVYNP